VPLALYAHICRPTWIYAVGLLLTAAAGLCLAAGLWTWWSNLLGYYLCASIQVQQPCDSSRLSCRYLFLVF
jgi:hypothetical protein